MASALDTVDSLQLAGKEGDTAGGLGNKGRASGLPGRDRPARQVPRHSSEDASVCSLHHSTPHLLLNLPPFHSPVSHNDGGALLLLPKRCQRLLHSMREPGRLEHVPHWDGRTWQGSD